MRRRWYPRPPRPMYCQGGRPPLGGLLLTTFVDPNPDDREEQHDRDSCDGGLDGYVRVDAAVRRVVDCSPAESFDGWAHDGEIRVGLERKSGWDQRCEAFSFKEVALKAKMEVGFPRGLARRL